jgi:hypothetical protein
MNDIVYNQVAVWPATILNESEYEDFKSFVAEHCAGTRVEVLGTFETLPDMQDGVPVPETGGRRDVYFRIHNEDVAKFAIPRFQFGMRWLEDVLDNDASHVENGDQEQSIYPAEVQNLDKR